MTNENLWSSTNGGHQRRSEREAVDDSIERRSALTSDCVANSHTQGDAIAHLNPRWLRVGARIFGSSLDSRLARGQFPETIGLLSARVELLVSQTTRRKIADSWLGLLVQAHRTFSRFDLQVPLVRSRVIAAASEINELSSALLAPIVSARGVALATSLLTDGTGPVYNLGASLDLSVALRDVIQRLDPLAREATASNR
jgi:hypothetical protein